MNNNIDLIKFLEDISNGSEPTSLSFSDFFPIESIVDYRTFTFNDETTIIQYSDYLKKLTKRIIVNMNTNKHHSFEKTRNIIDLIRSQFKHNDIEIELGNKYNDNEHETTVDIVLYK